MNESPIEFSVIISTYNRANFIQTAIQSVIDQEFTNWELIVVDDASSDNTAKVLEQYADRSNIRVIRNQKNLHKGGARNVGIDAAKGNYICFLDDDDYYEKNHLSVFDEKIRELREPFGMLYTMPLHLDSATGTARKYSHSPKPEDDQVDYLFDSAHPIPTPCSCIPRSILLKEKFNPHIRIGQDTELFMRIALHHTIIPIEAHTVVQRVHESNSGNTRFNAGKERLEGYKYIFENHELASHIRRKTRNKMIAHCYYRMAEHYRITGQKWEQFKALSTSLYYEPKGHQTKTKVVSILYLLPGGSLLRRAWQSIKKK